MNQRRKKNTIPRAAVRSALVVPAIVLLGACADDDDGPVGVETGEEPFLEEIFHFTVENDVQFGSALDENGTEEALLLDLFQPTDDEAALRPAVIWLHGGGYRAGHKGEMTEYARRFAQRGFVSASANYRLRENAEFDYTDPDDPLAEEIMRDAQHDVQAAVRWLRAHADEYAIDTDRIFVAGYSAGGTAGLRAAAYPDDAGTSGNPDQSSSIAAAVAVSGYLEPGVLEAISGATLLIHGEEDTKVPFAEVEAACSSVATCEIAAIPGEGHTMISSSKEEIIAETASFLHDQVVD